MEMDTGIQREVMGTKEEQKEQMEKRLNHYANALEQIRERRNKTNDNTGI